MRKIIIVLLVLVLAGALVLKMAFVKLGPSTVGIADITADGDSMTIHLVNANSGLRLSRFSSSRVENGQIILKIYGTLFSGLKLPGSQITVHGVDPERIDSVVISGTEYAVREWIED